MAKVRNHEYDGIADNIKQLLECSICLQRFEQPKSLPCLHTFCETCLETLVLNENNIQCPECRAIYILSSDGVSGLPTNFTMVSLMDISPIINDHKTGTDTKLASHACSDCGTETIQYDLTACPQCDEDICPVCSVSHFTDIKASLYKYAHRIHNDVARIYDARYKLEVDLRQLMKRGEDIKIEINENVDRIIDELRDREKSLCQQVDGYVNNASSLLQSEMTDLEAKLTSRLSLSASIDSAIAKLHNNIEGDMETLMAILAQCSDFIDKDNEDLPSSFEMRRNYNFNFMSIDAGELSESILKFGEVTIETQDRNIGNKTTEVAMVTTPMTAYHKRQGRVLIYENHTDGFSAPLGVAVSPTGDRIYVTIDFSDYSCRHDTAVQIFDERGRHVKTSRGSGGEFSGFKSPMGIAVNKDGDVVVADAKKQCVVVLNREGDYNFSFGKYGKRDGEFNTPVGVAVDGSCSIYVCDYHNRRIQVFNRNGGFMRKFVEPADLPGGFAPRYLTFSHVTGRVYSTDWPNHRVLVYSTLGEFIGCFGTRGKAEGEMDFPCGICVDDDGRVIVADHDNNRVQVFHDDGTFQCTLGAHVAQKPRLPSPVGLTIDKTGRLFVVDNGNKKVIVFNTSPS